MKNIFTKNAYPNMDGRYEDFDIGLWEGVDVYRWR